MVRNVIDSVVLKKAKALGRDTEYLIDREIYGDATSKKCNRPHYLSRHL